MAVDAAASTKADGAVKDAKIGRSDRIMIRTSIIGVVIAVIGSLVSVAVSIWIAHSSDFNSRRDRCVDALLTASDTAEKLSIEYYAPARQLPAVEPADWASLDTVQDQVLAACFDRDLLPPGSPLGSGFSTMMEVASTAWVLMTHANNDGRSPSSVAANGVETYCYESLAYVTSLSEPSIWPWRGPSGNPEGKL